MTYFYQIHTCKSDYTSLIVCLKCVKAYDPDVFVQVICDGAYMDKAQEDSVRKYASQIVVGEKLKLWKDTRMSWSERRFKLAIESKHDVCIKLDPDTRMWRKPLYVPRADYFGTISASRHPIAKISYVQGGCMGLSIRMIEDILKADLTSILKIVPIINPNNGLFMEDPTIGLMAKALGIEHSHWDEVMSRYSGSKDTRNPLVNGIPRYAITHPHKQETPEDAQTKIQD